MNPKYFILFLLFPICLMAQESKVTLTDQQKKAIESKKVDFILKKIRWLRRLEKEIQMISQRN